MLFCRYPCSSRSLEKIKKKKKKCELYSAAYTFERLKDNVLSDRVFEPS